MDDLEKVFLNNPGDAYAIYQLKHTQDTRDLRFASMSQVMMAGKKIDREKYDLLYIGDLPGQMNQRPGDVLDEIYARFNIMKPEDFTGHSLSMSDIIGLKQNGSVSFHYVDTVLCSLPLLCTLYHMKTEISAASVFIPICAGAAPAWGLSCPIFLRMKSI